jgi:hypothetical protein
LQTSPNIPALYGSENTIPPGGVVSLLQIKEDSDEILAQQESILYVVL